MKIYKNFSNFLVMTYIIGVGLAVRIVLRFQAAPIIANKELLVVRVQPRECELFFGTDQVCQDLLDLACVHVN